ncbi:MAG: TetR/AcrR family transcriptional regulator [Pseudomonadota bacterium]
MASNDDERRPSPPGDPGVPAGREGPGEDDQGEPGEEGQRQGTCHRPPAQERAQARRQQVLEAADVCFRRHGFHCASMAEISKKAGMSAGHIYHYFESKEAIINCIVQMDLEDALDAIDEGARQHSDLVETIATQLYRHVADHLDRHRASIMLEALAEAGRNPKVAALVQEADEKIRHKLRGLLAAGQRASAQLDESELQARVEILITLFNGLTVRAISNPGLDHEAVVRVLRRTIEHLLP